MVLGALALGRIDDTGLRRLLGGILVALVVLYFIRRANGAGAAAEPPAYLRNPWLVGLTGVLAGFTTMVANASGPIMILYLLALRLPKLIFIGTSAWFFLALNLLRLPNLAHRAHSRLRPGSAGRLSRTIRCLRRS